MSEKNAPPGPEQDPGLRTLPEWRNGRLVGFRFVADLRRRNLFSLTMLQDQAEALLALARRYARPRPWCAYYAGQAEAFRQAALALERGETP
jgi:hypothetical protein